MNSARRVGRRSPLPGLQRILVIGSGGAGKSTLARELAASLSLPLVHLDQHYWHPGWTPTPEAEWDRVVDRLIAEERWVMDGNYGRTLERRLQRAQAVVWLDLSRWVCIWRVIRRQASYLGRVRPDLPAGCRERASLDFLLWVWTYPSRRRPGIRRRLAALPASTQVIVLQSARELRAFIASLPSAS